MNVEDFVFELPEELIAAHPSARRDESRLLVLPRTGAFEHRRFRDIAEYLRPGDLLVVNDSRVLPARLHARRATGGRVEILLLHPEAASDRHWRAFVRPAKKIHTGDVLTIAEGFTAEVTGEHEAGERALAFTCDGPFREALERYGQLPLPPYIVKRREALHEPAYEEADRERYQTVYARQDGSVAAPTAGLHFTEDLLAQLQTAGVGLARVTLHVGAGTFQTMEEGGRVEEHRMHFEEYEVSEETAALVTAARREGRRVIAVGTTSVRTLESAWNDAESSLVAGASRTNLMIAPGYRYRAVDAIITNFHLPRSTLLLLVGAFIGRERMLEAYQEAIAQRYHFFSYGDAMLLLP